MGLAALLLCGAGLLLEHPDPAAFTGASIGALVYLGTFASVAGFLAYFQLLRELGPVPLSLVFVFFPVVAQAVAVAGGERPLRTASLVLLGVVLAASAAALSPSRSPGRRRPRRPASAPVVDQQRHAQHRDERGRVVEVAFLGEDDVAPFRAHVEVAVDGVLADRLRRAGIGEPDQRADVEQVELLVGDLAAEFFAADVVSAAGKVKPRSVSSCVARLAARRRRGLRSRCRPRPACPANSGCASAAAAISASAPSSSLSACSGRPTALPTVVISSCQDAPQSIWPGGWAIVGAIVESVS